MAEYDSLKEKLDYWRKNGAPGRLRRQGTSKTTPVVADEGIYRGQVVGTRTEHWSDQIDAKVSKVEITPTPLMERITNGS